ncbi:hypothetical protein Scep_006744 [Stephania cephalantha]|uniref:Pectinesterase inhibitor domain-containing protein n=1 Tax=Stephania cephalantha TaxID=152367 RepID=A0AAP0K8Q3_9MAGN
MSPTHLTLLLLLLSLSTISSSSASTRTQRSPTDFIKSSCLATTYPSLCYQSLSTYASTIQQNPKQLAQTALSVSLSRARSASSSISHMLRSNPPMRPRESQALKDCVETMGDSVDRLAKSINELSRLGGRVGGQSFLWHMSNVQTWVSAALTDDSTCVDGFAGHALDGRVKAQIRSRVLNVAQVTSNALALVNRFAAKYQP